MDEQKQDKMFNSTIANKTGNNEKSPTGSIILVLSFAVFISCLCKIVFVKFLRHRINLSFYVFVLFNGFIIGIIATHIKGGYSEDDFLRGELHLSKISPHLIYYIFLPLITFDSSFNSNFYVLKQQLLTTIFVSGISVFISTTIITLFIVYLFPYDYQWSWIIGLLFASILSTTDPVTIVTLLQECGTNPSLSSLIEAESLLNDGFVFLCFSVINRILVADSYAVRQIIIDIVRYGFGGPLFGLICGFICVFILNRINNELKIEITITFGITYLVFYIADADLNISAVLSLIAMGLYMVKHKYCISSNVQLSMAGAWEIIIFIVNILLFTLSGLILAHSFANTDITLTSRDFGITLVLYVLIHVSRVLATIVLHPVMLRSGMILTPKECVIFAWSGLRGRAALIIVLLVYLDSKLDRAARERFLFHISSIVLLTLIINGTSSKFLVKMLGLHKGTPESQSVLLQALKHIRTHTARHIHKMKEDINFAHVNWDILNNYLPEKLLEQLDKKYHKNTHQQLSGNSGPTEHDFPLESVSIDSQSCQSQHNSDKVSLHNIHQSSLDSLPNEQCSFESFIQPAENLNDNMESYQAHMKNEIIKRFLTAMSIDYEKQWYLGMIRRRTLKILIETVEQAKTSLSLKRHWQILSERFRMPLSLRCLLTLSKIKCLNRIVENLLFSHLILIIELALAFHSAISHMENVLTKFPEFANIDNYTMAYVLHEAKLLQIRVSLVLYDLQHSYKNCWAIEMTKRCAQMLLKYESVAIVQLYETGMLNSNEYTHILRLIQKKLFHLEYDHFMGIPKIHLNREQDDLLKNLLLFSKLTENEKRHFKDLLRTRHKWFQPGEVLIRTGSVISEAYLIVRGIVECSEDLLTCYRSGNIIGIDLLFEKPCSISTRTYKAQSSIVEVYVIDKSILSMLLSNERMSRIVYNEIAFHVLINMYRKPIHLLNCAQIKVLLDEYAKFYIHKNNDDDMTISVRRNERAFLLTGTVQREDDDYFIDGPQLITVNRTASFYCGSDQLCIVYKWKQDDEQECLQMVRSFTTSFQLTRSNEIKPNKTMVYPSYLDYSTEFIPQYHSLIQVARSAAETSNIELIPIDTTDLYTDYV